MAFGLAIVAIQADDLAVAIVELPEAHAWRRERAPDGFGQPPERFPIARIEQGRARGQLVEGGRLRRQRPFPPAQRPRIALGAQSLIGQQRRKTDGQGDDAAGHQKCLAAVGGDETDQLVLGNDEHEPPVPCHRLGEQGGRHDVAAIVDLDDRSASTCDADPIMGLGEHRLADRIDVRGPKLALGRGVDHRRGVRKGDQPALGIDDHGAAARADLRGWPGTR